MTFTAEQVERLLRPIKAHRVLQAQGQSHIPAYDVVAHLNRMFGFGGWDKEIRSIELVEERNDVPGKNGWYVTYRCHMRLIIRDPEGNVTTTKEDGACGSANNLPSLGDAHDFAYKNAISYALKRCAKDLGDQFGLSLYNKGATGALVGTTLVGLGQVGTTVDLEDHAPTPLSLGNDERQVDHETGEISGGGAEGAAGAPAPVNEPQGSARPAASREPSPASLSASTEASGAGSEAADEPHGERGNTEPPSNGVQDDRGLGVNATQPPTITTAQMKKMQALMNHAGIVVPQDKRDYAGGVIGRTLDSARNLTVAEAARVIDALEQLEGVKA